MTTTIALINYHDIIKEMYRRSTIVEIGFPIMSQQEKVEKENLMSRVLIHWTNQR